MPNWPKATILSCVLGKGFWHIPRGVRHKRLKEYAGWYARQGGTGLIRAHFGTAKFGAEKLWHQFSNTSEKLGTTSVQQVAQHAYTVNGGYYYLQAFGWLLLFPRGLEPAWSVPVEQTATGTCMPRALTLTPGKMAADLKIPWHNLALFLCQNFAVPNPVSAPPPPVDS